VSQKRGETYEGSRYRYIYEFDHRSRAGLRGGEKYSYPCLWTMGGRRTPEGLRRGLENPRGEEG